MNCKNCGEVLTGKYCSKCGQKASVDKLNLSSFSSEISDGVFNMNKGLFYTIKELFLLIQKEEQVHGITILMEIMRQQMEAKGLMHNFL